MKNKMKRDSTSPWSTNRYVPTGQCIPPRIFRFALDTTSTAPYYDELGRPKLYTPTRQNEAGEWLYALNPNRDGPALSGLALADHLREITIPWRKVEQ